MGACMAKQSPKVRICFAGGGGQTTVVYKLQLGEVVTTIPTTGFNMEDFRYRKTAISVLDCGEMVMENPARYAVLLGKLNAIVLVVDAALPETWERSSRDLKAALEHCPLARAILVFCNKMDLPEARSPSVVTDALNLQTITAVPWYVQSCSASSGDGLYDGMDWLIQQWKRGPRTVGEAADRYKEKGDAGSGSGAPPSSAPPAPSVTVGMATAGGEPHNNRRESATGKAAKHNNNDDS